jgi:arsenate reductase
MTVTIFHNPECGTSRNTLAMFRQSGVEPIVIEYLKTPPDRATVIRLIADAGLSVRQALRQKDTPFNLLGLGGTTKSDEELIDAIGEHPILLNRPFVVTPKGRGPAGPPRSCSISWTPILGHSQRGWRGRH